ncbi:MAG TPA: hypothetical protein VFX66_02825 [Sulfuricurvum sp.]|nr:hypothetical protein [Sulfuricurvum sp.]
MKRIIFVALFLALNSLVYADSSIDQEIAQILKAPQAQRAQMMNQLKTKLAAMNAQERSEAIHNLQIGLNGNSAGAGIGQNMKMQNMHSNVQHQGNIGSMNHQPNNSRR